MSAPKLFGKFAKGTNQYRKQMLTLAELTLSFVIAFQVYFLRELLVAELLLILMFLLLVAFGSTVYFVGAVSQHGLRALEAKAHDFAEIHARHPRARNS